MARALNKPKEIRESDLKDVVCPVEIEIDMPEEVVEVVKEEPKEEVPAVIAQPITPVKKSIPPAPLTIPFNIWFHKKSSDNSKIKVAYKEAILAHFLAVGLKEEELPEKYEVALKNFGL
jgi:hypothetical protein